MPLEFFYNPILKATTALGVPVPLAKAFFYAAGSSSALQNTYADSGQISANANPVVADANGLFPDIFLLPLAYHVIIKDTTETITYFDQDNLAGPLFSVLFDDTWLLKDNLDPTKILKFQCSSITTATTRTKTAADTNGVLIDSLYGIMGATRFQMTKGSNVTAANDLTLPSDGNVFTVIGATTINRIATSGWQDGSIVTLSCSGTPTVAHNVATGGGFSGILLDGSANRAQIVNGTLMLQLISNAWMEIPRKS